MTNDRFQRRPRWRDLLSESFGGTFWLFVVLATITGVTCYVTLGSAAFDEAISANRDLLVGLLPRLAAAQVIASLVWVLVPRTRLSRLLGNGGRWGLLVATAAGMMTPGGPASAFPLLAVMAGAGADRGILIAYITSWALLGVQRIVVWDIPFMGLDFSMMRFLVCLPLPLLAGAMARRLPLSMTLRMDSTVRHDNPQ